MSATPRHAASKVKRKNRAVPAIMLTGIVAPAAATTVSSTASAAEGTDISDQITNVNFKLNNQPDGHIHNGKTFNTTLSFDVPAGAKDGDKIIVKVPYFEEADRTTNINLVGPDGSTMGTMVANTDDQDATGDLKSYTITLNDKVNGLSNVKATATFNIKEDTDATDGWEVNKEHVITATIGGKTYTSGDPILRTPATHPTGWDNSQNDQYGAGYRNVVRVTGDDIHGGPFTMTMTPAPGTVFNCGVMNDKGVEVLGYQDGADESETGSDLVNSGRNYVKPTTCTTDEITVTVDRHSIVDGSGNEAGAFQIDPFVLLTPEAYAAKQTEFKGATWELKNASGETVADGTDDNNTYNYATGAVVGDPTSPNEPTPTGDPAKGVDDSGTVKCGETITLDVLANDVPATGAKWNASTLHLVDATGQAVDTLEVEQGTYKVVDGKLTFTAATDCTAGDVPPAKYTVTDDKGNTVVPNVTITKTVDTPPATTPPTAAPDSAKVKPGESVNLHVVDNDTKGSADLDPSTIKIKDADGNWVTGPVAVTGGSYSVVNGDIVFTAGPDYTASIPSIPYQIADTAGKTAESTVSVSEDAPVVVPPTDTPAKGVDDAGTVKCGEAVTVDVLANDIPTTGATWDASTLHLVDAEGKSVESLKVNGGTYSVADGKIVFTADKDCAVGDIPPAKYTVTDTKGNPVTPNVTITETKTDTPPVKTPPVANPDESHVKCGESVTLDVLANDDAKGAKFDASTLKLIDAEGKPVDSLKVNGGTYSVAGGKIVFTADKDCATGEIPTVPYQVTTDGGDTAKSTVKVTEDKPTPPVVTPPAGQDDSGHVKCGESITVDVLANDTATSGSEWDASTLKLVGAAADGTLKVNGGTYSVKDGKVVFTADKDCAVGDIPPAKYTVTDKAGNPITQTVTIVEDKPDTPVQPTPPAGKDDTGKVKCGESITIDVLANDVPTEGGKFDASKLMLLDADGKEVSSLKVNGGTYSVKDGKVVFTADADCATGDIPPVKYTVPDDKGGKITQIVTVTEEKPDVPVETPKPAGQDDSGVVKCGESVTVDVLANDKVAEGAKWNASTLHLLDDKGAEVDTVKVAGGTYSVKDGKVVFTADKDCATGDIPPVKYTVTDDHGNKITQTVTIKETKPETPVETPKTPTAKPDTSVVECGKTVTIDVFANDDAAGSTFDPASLHLLDANGKQVDEVKVNGGVYSVKDGKVLFTADKDCATGEIPSVPYVAKTKDGKDVKSTVGVKENKPVEKPADKPTETPKPTEKPAETPKPSTPVTKPADKPVQTPVTPGHGPKIQTDYSSDASTDLSALAGVFAIGAAAGTVVLGRRRK